MTRDNLLFSNMGVRCWCMTDSERVTERLLGVHWDPPFGRFVLNNPLVRSLGLYIPLGSSSSSESSPHFSPSAPKTDAQPSTPPRTTRSRSLQGRVYPPPLQGPYVPRLTPGARPDDYQDRVKEGPSVAPGSGLTLRYPYGLYPGRPIGGEVYPLGRSGGLAPSRRPGGGYVPHGVRPG
jgi:hypothetical protein